ncbi:2'-5' RNA ligase family protein [Calditerricola satsumensis]|uniref:Putative phosphoesterase GCM10007043_10720 n=1 Tax=Calditerricola satsumensis TaxID=373054 RepID=A0A8J3BEQ1_9BACI|nr:2'-5' RNA ligase family protein [Calditerricola satsumensis]GGJ98599.1 putative phosphoesterase [Calditerricola satsumensis]
MLYCVCLFPRRDVQERANSYRKRYDPQYARIPPHIKVTEPFTLADDELPAAVANLTEVAKGSEPFTLHFHKFGTFHPTNNVIFFAIQDEPALQKLHRRLYERVVREEPRNPFIPHLTIGQDLTDEELLDVYGRLRMTELNLVSPIDRFHLLYRLDDGTWTVYQTFLFGKEC